MSPAGSVINGLIGDGSRSDNVSAICIPTAVNQATWAPLGVICNWTWRVSEEIGTTSWAYPGIGRAEYFRGWGFGYRDRGVRCSGSFCDNMSYYACAAVNAYISHEFSTRMTAGIRARVWSPAPEGRVLERGGLVRYMTGVSANGAAISPELRPHRALCVGQNDRLDYYGTTNWASRLRSHNINNGDHRGTPACAIGMWVSPRASAPGQRSWWAFRKRPPTRSADPLRPDEPGAIKLRSCTVLPYSNVTDNRINTLSSDWDPGYSKNECGLKQVLKGISRQLHDRRNSAAMLCCDQQPDANP